MTTALLDFFEETPGALEGICRIYPGMIHDLFDIDKRSGGRIVDLLLGLWSENQRLQREVLNLESLIRDVERTASSTCQTEENMSIEIMRSALRRVTKRCCFPDETVVREVLDAVEDSREPLELGQVADSDSRVVGLAALVSRGKCKVADGIVWLTSDV